MMTGTLITDRNREFFLHAVEKQIIDEGDIFIGVIDEDSNTACGVLVAKEQEGLSLDITYLYVAKEWRNKGAGTKLIDTLRNVADSLEAERIVCTNARGIYEDEVSSLLESCGFAKDTDQTYPIYRVKPADIEIKGTGKASKAGRLISLKDISDDEWAALPKEWSKASGDEMTLDALMTDKKTYNGEKSCLSFGHDGKLNGVFLLAGDEGDYSLEAFGAAGKEAPAVSGQIFQNFEKLSDENTSGKNYLNVCPSRNKEEEFLMHVTEGAVVQTGEVAYYTLELTV